jgi:hypothetical protein
LNKRVENNLDTMFVLKFKIDLATVDFIKLLADVNIDMFFFFFYIIMRSVGFFFLKPPFSTSYRELV